MICLRTGSGNRYFARSKSKVHVIFIVVGNIACIVCDCNRRISGGCVIKNLECQRQNLSVIGGIRAVKPYCLFGIAELSAESDSSFYIHKIKSACIVIESQAEGIYTRIIADRHIKRYVITSVSLCARNINSTLSCLRTRSLNRYFTCNKSKVHIIFIVVGNIACIVCDCNRRISGGCVIKNLECQRQNLSVIGGICAVEPYRLFGIGKLSAESAGCFDTRKA